MLLEHVRSIIHNSTIDSHSEDTCVRSLRVIMNLDFDFIETPEPSECATPPARSRSPDASDKAPVEHSQAPGNTPTDSACSGSSSALVVPKDCRCVQCRLILFSTEGKCVPYTLCNMFQR